MVSNIQEKPFCKLFLNLYKSIFIILTPPFLAKTFFRGTMPAERPIYENPQIEKTEPIKDGRLKLKKRETLSIRQNTNN